MGVSELQRTEQKQFTILTCQWCGWQTERYDAVGSEAVASALLEKKILTRGEIVVCIQEAGAKIGEGGTK